jgi:hypothetical protein
VAGEIQKNGSPKVLRSSTLAVLTWWMVLNTPDASLGRVGSDVIISAWTWRLISPATAPFVLKPRKAGRPRDGINHTNGG